MDLSDELNSAAPPLADDGESEAVAPETAAGGFVLSVPDEYALAAPERTPFVERDQDGSYRILREPDMEEDFTPWAREMFGDDWMGALRTMSDTPQAAQAEYERLILQQSPTRAKWLRRKISPNGGPTSRK
ncbi:MAG: hypothetical protein LUG50_11620 [Planctomycetaceae bacterium]|nr:hypothetical protein [Planctomycetaceae bacterium]